MTIKRDGLTAGQMAYCRARAVGLAQVDAYRHAYPNGKASAATVRREAARLETRPLVKVCMHEFARRGLEQVESTVLVDLKRALFENAAIAFSDVGKIIDPDSGKFKPIDLLDESTRRAIAGVRVRKVSKKDEVGNVSYEEIVEYKFWDKGAALDRFLRHFGGYAKDHAGPTDPFDGIPRETVKQILEKLREFAAPRAVADRSAMEWPSEKCHHT